MKKRDNIIAGLDIGTSKVCVVAGEFFEEGIDIIGIGTHPSHGLRRGVVVNIESTVTAISKAIEEAELMAGCEILSVYASIGGGHIKGFNSNGVVAINNGREVRDSDIARVIEAAKAVAIPLDREVLHVVPQEYVVDDQDGIKKPIGMAGVRLEAKVHVITGALSAAQNIIKCANRAGLEVKDIVLEPLAAAEAVLSSDEKELGVALIDIGGGTTSIIIYVDGSVAYTSVLSIGGNHLTNDIAVGLRTPIGEALKIKERRGCAYSELISASETIEVPSVGGRDPRVISRKVLGEIIEPRVEEIMSLIYRELTKSGFIDRIASGVVITGGTTSMEGMTELSEKILGLPVRRGIPAGVGGLVDIVRSPIYSTSVGLVMYGAKQDRISNISKPRMDNFYMKARKRLSDLLGDLF